VLGTVMSLQPLQHEYPDSQFQCVNVRSAASLIFCSHAYRHFLMAIFPVV